MSLASPVYSSYVLVKVWFLALGSVVDAAGCVGWSIAAEVAAANVVYSSVRVGGNCIGSEC